MEPVVFAIPTSEPTNTFFSPIPVDKYPTPLPEAEAFPIKILLLVEDDDPAFSPRNTFLLPLILFAPVFEPRKILL